MPAKQLQGENDLPPDPFAEMSLETFGQRFRDGSLTSEAVVTQYLHRIARIEPWLNALTDYLPEQALDCARAMDRLAARGVDLGPLMGVPVLMKDLYSVQSFPPPKIGSRVDVQDLISAEGTLVRNLRRGGVVVLGRTRMTEFAFGIVNVETLPPWNPWDTAVHHMTGGSSSGSAAALAAGLCAFSLGSDTGGSVRQPAALCGVFGFKASAGMLPMDGVFPLAPSLDSAGCFTRSAADAALVHAVLSGESCEVSVDLRGAKIGVPDRLFYEDLDPGVAQAMQEVHGKLERAGVQLQPIALPGLDEVFDCMLPVLSAELLAHLGIERFKANQHLLDSVVRHRLEEASLMSATQYVRARKRLYEIQAQAARVLQHFDAWISPTSAGLPVPVSQVQGLEAVLAWTHKGNRNTRPGNLLGCCGVSLPYQTQASKFPAGVQLMSACGADQRLLALAQSVERVIGRVSLPG